MGTITKQYEPGVHIKLLQICLSEGDVDLCGLKKGGERMKWECGGEKTGRIWHKTSFSAVDAKGQKESSASISRRPKATASVGCMVGQSYLHHQN